MWHAACFLPTWRLPALLRPPAQEPHALVKPICLTAHTKEPTHQMPHCCTYKDGFLGVDENFEPLRKGKACWFQPEGREPGAKHPGYQPRQRIQLSHFQRTSTESAVQKAVRDHVFYSHPSRNKTKKGGFDLVAALLEVAGSQEKPVVLPDARALGLLRSRAQQIKEALQW